MTCLGVRHFRTFTFTLGATPTVRRIPFGKQGGEVVTPTAENMSMQKSQEDSARILFHPSSNPSTLKLCIFFITRIVPVSLSYLETHVNTSRCCITEDMSYYTRDGWYTGRFVVSKCPSRKRKSSPILTIITLSGTLFAIMSRIPADPIKP